MPKKVSKFGFSKRLCDFKLQHFFLKYIFYKNTPNAKLEPNRKTLIESFSDEEFVIIMLLNNYIEQKFLLPNL